ncbi:MAG: substrate-binding periplasmic protein [Bdellovibrionales bacterium]
MKKALLLLSLFLVIAFPALAKEAKETAYDRIMRTGTIRCGYVVFAPNLMKDANTGAFSGVTYDVLQEIAKRLSLKVEMTFESDFGSMGEDMKSGKADMLCTSGWAYIPNARAHLVNSRPLFYNAVGAYVRKEDNRFSDVSELNSPKVLVAGVDSTAASDLARESFPKAKILSMPKITPYEFNIINVIEKKADVTFVDTDYAARFLAKQDDPKVLKNIAKDYPIRLFSSGFLLPMGEVELAQMINMSIEALHNEGFIEKVLQKYEAAPGTLIRVAPGYKL